MKKEIEEAKEETDTYKMEMLENRDLL